MSDEQGAPLESEPETAAAPSFFEQPEIDQLLYMVIALTGEVAALRARLDSHEQLSEAAGSWGRAQVEGLKPSGEQAQRRAQLKDELIARVMRQLADRHGIASSQEAK